jgi:hypothetical protein
VYLLGPDGKAEVDQPPAARFRGLGRGWPVLTVTAALAVLLVAAVIAHDDPDRASDVTPAPSSPSDLTAPTVLRSTPPTTALPPWPTTAAACGGEVSLPVLSDVGRLDAATGVRVVAGNTPRLVDVDAGASTTLPVRLTPDELVIELASDPQGTVALIASCLGTGAGDSMPTRLVRLAPDGSRYELSARAPGFAPGSLISGGDLTWLSRWPVQADGDYLAEAPMQLAPTIAGASPVRLPKGFIPRGGFRGLVIGNKWLPDGETNGPVEVFDLATRRVIARFGSPDVSYTVDNGRVVWASASCIGRCAVHVEDLADGTTRTVWARLDQGRSVGYGAISTDGAMASFLTYNNPPDPHFAGDHPAGPTGIAVLDLATGRMTDVPGIQLAPKSSITLSFAGKDHWLVLPIGLAEESRILMWRPGLAHPVDAGVGLPGRPDYSSPLTVA